MATWVLVCYDQLVGTNTFYFLKKGHTNEYTKVKVQIRQEVAQQKKNIAQNVTQENCCTLFISFW